jgi:glycine/D-amino acid oxidase-like deaminating enzyme
MPKFTMPTQDIPLDDSWDVIVAGGGPAGCTAATAAAREGAKTLLIEATGCLGGMGTSGLVPAWCPFTDKEKIIYKGLAEKVLMACNTQMPHVGTGWTDWAPIDPELLKRIYDDMVTAAGATVLFNTQITAAYRGAAGKVDTLVAASKAGLTAYRAKVYVDCTGDADIAAWGGAEILKGETKTGDLQPATHCFILGNVDTYGYRHCGSISWGPNMIMPKILASGKFPEIPDGHSCNALIGPGTVGFNAGHVWKVDNTNPASVSAALMQGRKIAHAFQRALAEFFPQAFANAFLVATGSLLGIRETRRVVGDYMLTFDDYIARRSFDDEICRNSYYIDIHAAKADSDPTGTDREKFEAKTYRYNKGESHGVPYRCLTPRGLDNVLVAGRSISCDRAVQGSVRVMPVCLAMGEAAGLAAARAASSGKSIHALDTAELRATLRGYGAYLP